jgi:hypothetical protein
MEVKTIDNAMDLLKDYNKKILTNKENYIKEKRRIEKSLTKLFKSGLLKNKNKKLDTYYPLTNICHNNMVLTLKNYNSDFDINYFKLNKNLITRKITITIVKINYIKDPMISDKGFKLSNEENGYVISRKTLNNYKIENDEYDIFLTFLKKLEKRIYNFLIYDQYLKL